MTPPAPETVYLNGAPDPVCATLHRSAAEAARDTAVVICPPFGFDEVCSYRSLRDWAQRLAEEGYSGVRLSYPGTGDSGGDPSDPRRLDAWTDATSAAGRWLKAATGAERVAAIGIGLGGIVAWRAVAADAPIDDLVLWGTPARGRAFVRQLRAFSALELAEFFRELEPPPPLPPDELEAGGFLLNAETVRELSALDLTALPFPEARGRRVLLLDRDGIAVDARLKDHLESSGVAVTVASGQGYGAMTSHPQRARPPLALIERVTAWLGQGSAAVSEAPSPGPPAGDAASETQIKVGDDHLVRETVLTLEQPVGRLAAVLTEPVGYREPGLCVLFLNAGAVRRIGPNRMWVEAARRWAARGVPSVRLDVIGIGDADGETTPYAKDGALYEPELVPQVLAAVEAMHERGVGERFVLTGLCAGAYWSFHGALSDPRVIAALMVNPAALIWDPDQGAARDVRAIIANPTSWSKMRKEASWDRTVAILRWVLAGAKRRLSQFGTNDDRSSRERELDDMFGRLLATGKRLTFVFSDHEPLSRELVESGRMGRLEQAENVTLEYVAVRDHTLRPNWAQRQAHAALDRALGRELELNAERASDERRRADAEALEH